MRRRAAAAFAAAMLATSCAAADTNFSQYPGFAAYFAANPPADVLPAPADRALLARHRPRLFVAAGAEGPIRFYEDYVARGRLTAGDGRPVPGPVTRQLLNAHRDEPSAVFAHVPAAGAATAPVLYGRVDRETFDLDGRERRFTFLTWHAVFRVSGIAAGIAWWKAAALGLAGDLDDWHQLDHYTAVTLALDEGARPVAAMFQQHNYRRTYVLGRDLDLPPDGRLAVDAALRSNELYPHRPGRTVRRAAGFLNAATVAHIVLGEGAAFRAADDVTHPAREVDAALRFLPPADAFYTFKGFLGEIRMLPGRSGPPGADYNTRPSLKPLHRQMIAFHWRENDAEYVRWFGEPDRGFAKLAARFAALIGG